MFKEIKKLQKRGYKCIVGIDEAGRGPLAGPVVACATKLKIKNEKGKTKINLSRFNLTNFRAIKDSKQLSAKQRDEWYKILTEHSNLEWGVGIVSEKIIDKINILEATKLAMRRAVEKLKVQPDFLIIDGNFILGAKNLAGVQQKAIVRADEKIFLCAAASIIAKVTRDRMMVKLHKKYSQYGFDKHKGYGTKKHLRALKKYGACGIHRRSFGPIRRIIDN